MRKETKEYKDRLNELSQELGSYQVEGENPYIVESIVDDAIEFKLLPRYMVHVNHIVEDNKISIYLLKDRVRLIIKNELVKPECKGFAITGVAKWAILQYILKLCNFEFTGYSGEFKIFKGMFNGKTYKIGFTTRGGSFMKRVNLKKEYFEMLKSQNREAKEYSFYKKEEGYQGQNPYILDEHTQNKIDDMIEYLSMFGYEVREPAR